MVATTEIEQVKVTPVEYPPELAALAREYGKLSSAARLAEFRRLLGVDAENIRRKAVIVAEMIRHGDDLTEIRRLYDTQVRRLMMVAEGRLLAEAVEAFMGKPWLLQPIASLPVSRQRKLLGDGAVEVAVKTEPGHFDRRMMSLSDIRPPLVKQIFASDGERSFEQQVAWIEGRPYMASPKPLRQKHVKVELKLGGVRITAPSFLTLQDLEHLVEELKRG